ncbi:hypothetical protein [Carboxylicivirga sp. M1479]|uniref:hypothetical protein n=1 Tax=Carboxylicivirga sp. M1479 TaxID=2594476 RepID=UPI0011780A10|nr:hypothetical protein [Carboxylicivirga sp. M1479]TRX71496.1 hypothetical protein FNN09_05875 [Carboxylicivirga sp. M1479]
MALDTVVIVRNDEKMLLEAYSGIVKACEDLKLPYHELANKRFPFKWEGYVFYKKEIIKY